MNKYFSEIFNCLTARLFIATLFAIQFSTASATESDSNARLLDEYLPSSCHHSGQYQQEKKMEGIQNPLVSGGDFIFSCEKGLIWHTETPVTETAIYATSGKHYLVAGETMTPLDSRVHKALGTLLNHLVGGDADYLLRNFAIAELNDSLQLTPKQKRLKRAIQHIIVSPNDEQVMLKLQHSDSEYTLITISATRTYDTLDARSCSEKNPTKTLACVALFN